VTHDDLLQDLTPSQREAVTHGEGPLLVVAGPGSGKTRVITSRVAYLVRTGVTPWHILAITFTNKAAQEMARRVETSGTPPGAWIKTFHATCAALLRRYADRAGLLPGFTIFDTQDQRRVVRGVLRQMDLPQGALKPAGVRAQISRWKTGGVSPDNAEADAGGFFEQKQAEVYRAYEAALAVSNAVDFDDLLGRTLQMLEQDAGVRERLQERFRHVLIDEYQDTSPVQFRLASILAQPQQNICATGDPDQSIYAFRNADVRNILEFERNYPGARVVRLEENFRSTAYVLRAADALIVRNQNRHAKLLVPTREDGEKVRIVGAADEHAEGLALADAVLGAYGGGVPYRDMAIFYRVNAQSRAIETALRGRGVPYMIVKGVEFYQRAEVKDLVAYLKVLANPADRESMVRVLTTPRRGVGAKTIERMYAMAHEHGWTARRALLGAADSGEFRKQATLALRDLEHLLATLEAGVSGSVAELVRDAITHLRYEEYLKKAYPEDWQDRVENVRELIGGADEYDSLQGEDASLRDFLHQVSLVSDADQYDPDMPRVALMTLHSAKGLEFRHVYVAGVERELLPHARAADDEGGIEEERRLLFVGMTRAKDRLTLSFARDRRARLTGGFGGGASDFLMELDPDALDVAGGGLSPVWSSGGSSFDDAPWGRVGGRVGCGAPKKRPRDASEFHADVVPEYGGTDQDPAEVLQPGQRVNHPTFGDGTVRRLSGRGGSTRVVVFFVGRGEKTLALEYAHLTPIWDA